MKPDPGLHGTAFRVKICGLSTAETLEAALDAGADLIGLVFHPKSPRLVTMKQAMVLADQARGRAGIVALVADVTAGQAAALVQALKPDWLQLHGRETTGQVAAIADATGVRILKAVGVSAVDDLASLAAFKPVCDGLLLDAKPPRHAAYPGGHGRPFDWDILQGLDPKLAFMLSGGLDPGNLAGAIARIRAMGVRLTGVDVSSGVESAPGVKDVAKIRRFIEEAHRAFSGAR